MLHNPRLQATRMEPRARLATSGPEAGRRAQR
jgi:hypothetical protein